jgi:general secretion pathway protein M
MAEVLSTIGERFRSLSSRERLLVYAMLATAVLLVLVLVFVMMQRRIGELERGVEANDDVLSELASEGDRYLARLEAREREEARFDREIPPLPGLLERLAGEAGIEIPESRELPDDPIGKKWVRKSVEVRLRRVGLKAFTDFMVKIENENKRIPLAITHLQVKRRAAEPDSYDVDITVSAYQKARLSKKKEEKERRESSDDRPKVYGPAAER